MNSSDEEHRDDAAECIYPQPSGEWHRANTARLERERAALAETENLQFKSMLSDITARAVAYWQTVPCKGDDAGIVNCSDDYATTCKERNGLSCPRYRIEDAARQRAAMHARQRKYLADVGVSPRTLRAVFDAEPIETEAVRAIRAAFSGPTPPTIVILQGGVGCGKSCAAALWASEKSAKWVTAKALARMGYDDDIEKLGNCDALVLDDLGTEYADAKGFFVSNLDGLIDDRYARELPTVITTNVPPDEFKARYGERIADRIREAGKFIKVAGESMRRRA